MLIANWKEVLKKSAVVWVTVIGALIPELPDIALRWLASEPSAEVLSPQTKNYLRMFLMIVAVPFARIWRQTNMPPDQVKTVSLPVVTGTKE